MGWPDDYGGRSTIAGMALIDELIESVDADDDYLEVIVRGAPKLNVTLAEVRLGCHGEFQSCRRTVRNHDYTTCAAAAVV